MKYINNNISKKKRIIFKIKYKKLFEKIKTPFLNENEYKKKLILE